MKAEPKRNGSRTKVEALVQTVSSRNLILIKFQPTIQQFNPELHNVHVYHFAHVCQAISLQQSFLWHTQYNLGNCKVVQENLKKVGFTTLLQDFPSLCFLIAFPAYFLHF